jgi:oxygen-independent coproporphyrinogen-3 oxidase
MLGFGITAIGFLQNTYAQNCKELSSYYAALKQGLLPIYRGKILSKDDLIRKWVIEKVMCTFHIEKKEFAETFDLNFDSYFAGIDYSLYIHEGLMVDTQEALMVTQAGELFVRNLASLFDAYLTKTSLEPQFSQSI